MEGEARRKRLLDPHSDKKKKESPAQKKARERGEAQRTASDAVTSAPSARHALDTAEGFPPCTVYVDFTALAFTSELICSFLCATADLLLPSAPSGQVLLAEISSSFPVVLHPRQRANSDVREIVVEGFLFHSGGGWCGRGQPKYFQDSLSVQPDQSGPDLLRGELPVSERSSCGWLPREAEPIAPS